MALRRLRPPPACHLPQDKLNNAMAAIEAQKVDETMALIKSLGGAMVSVGDMAVTNCKLLLDDIEARAASCCRAAVLRPSGGACTGQGGRRRGPCAHSGPRHRRT